MHLIVYTSESNLSENDADKALIDISHKAKVNNLQLNITGLLFYHNHRFVQILEGEINSLEKLLSIIEKDKRHKNIERLIDEDINKRGFNKWNMDSFNLTRNDVIEPAELVNIGDAIKKNVVLDSILLASLYKTLLSSHELRPKI